MTTAAAVSLTVAILAAGVVTGTWVLVAAVIVPGRRLLSPEVNVQVHHAFDERFRYVPPLAAISVIAGVVATVLAHESRASLVLCAVGAASMAGAVVTSLRVNVPLNPHLPDWLSDKPPRAYEDVYGKWDSANLARTVMALVALGCYALGAGLL